MRHKNAGRKFDRDGSSRRAMFRNLAANLVLHERVETTDAKAKELRRVAERLITKARRLGDVAYTPWEELSKKDQARRLHASRLVAAYLPRFGVKLEEGASKKIDLVEKIFVDLAKRYRTRPGGYTRIIKIGPRAGDNAHLSLIELVEAGARKRRAERRKKGAKAARQKRESRSGNRLKNGLGTSRFGDRRPAHAALRAWRFSVRDRRPEQQHGAHSSIDQRRRDVVGLRFFRNGKARLRLWGACVTPKNDVLVTGDDGFIARLGPQGF